MKLPLRTFIASLWTHSCCTNSPSLHRCPCLSFTQMSVHRYCVASSELICKEWPGHIRFTGTVWGPRRHSCLSHKPTFLDSIGDPPFWIYFLSSHLTPALVRVPQRIEPMQTIYAHIDIHMHIWILYRIDPWPAGWSRNQESQQCGFFLLEDPGSPKSGKSQCLNLKSLKQEELTYSQEWPPFCSLWALNWLDEACPYCCSHFPIRMLISSRDTFTDSSE
jgi:hypothetical protein